MRKLFTLIVLVAATYFAVPANAQLKFGVKGGLNITNMSLSNDVFETSNRTGFFIGPTIKFTLPIVGLGIDASALYDQREGEVNVEADDNTIVSTKLKQKAINIPINLRYDIGLGSLAAVYLAAGPQFGFNVGDKNQSLYKDVAEWRLNTSNFSVNVGAGVMLLGHLQVGANYNIVCGKTGEITVLDGAKSVLRGRSNTWQISAAYYF
ncbi:porin family protein [uncultured Prevotella sp.]|uniref:porin family protein n=1 Tax=uncultured Prevotella sp. TaxID=159272 RepID=UPI00260FD709|nr:porin family protein [uncultured Prevotella sp.]